MGYVQCMSIFKKVKKKGVNGLYAHSMMDIKV